MDRDELVRLAGEKLASSIFRDAPTDVASLEARPIGEFTGNEVRLFIYRDVLDELAFAASYRHEPSFAVLIGAFAVDDVGPFLEVTGFSRFQHIATLDTLYNSLKPELDDIVDEVSMQRTPEDHIVGVFVGARGSGGKLSAEVARAHLSLFNVPYQVAVVSDPDASQLGVYARPPASRFYNSPFWVVEVKGEEGERAGEEE
ncbi:hypothetical protein FIV42_27380 [Persicimonas caeni]|uniref:Uncharacterized protein n=1 Tax=Persicimonas caeni TaxID=2292766 RepID=A0A4Y6Q1B4_PERCE|nr:hypothetical protein [Persicimonas caeni]QDG54333.1 hypothetical protein FIV42_27380 [Persicimonas caeni]QED35554.1 hypothetical protein FRD00_27375 [Persicimonas caeni]